MCTETEEKREQTSFIFGTRPTARHEKSTFIVQTIKVGESETKKDIWYQGIILF